MWDFKFCSGHIKRKWHWFGWATFQGLKRSLQVTAWFDSATLHPGTFQIVFLLGQPPPPSHFYFSPFPWLLFYLSVGSQNHYSHCISFGTGLMLLIFPNLVSLDHCALRQQHFQLISVSKKKKIPWCPQEKSKGLGFAVKVLSNTSTTIIEILIKAVCDHMGLTVCRTPHYVPITVKTLSYWIPTLTLWRRFYFHPHYQWTNQGTEKWLTCLVSKSQLLGWGSLNQRPGPKPVLLCTTIPLLPLQAPPASLCPGSLPASLGYLQSLSLLGLSSQFNLFQEGLPNYFCLQWLISFVDSCYMLRGSRTSKGLAHAWEEQAGAGGAWIS